METFTIHFSIVCNISIYYVIHPPFVKYCKCPCKYTYTCSWFPISLNISRLWCSYTFRWMHQTRTVIEPHLSVACRCVVQMVFRWKGLTNNFNSRTYNKGQSNWGNCYWFGQIWRFSSVFFVEQEASLVGTLSPCLYLFIVTPDRRQPTSVYLCITGDRLS